MQLLIPFIALEVSKNSKLVIAHNIKNKHRMIIFNCQPQWPGKINIFMLRYQQLFTNPLVGYIRPLI